MIRLIFIILLVIIVSNAAASFDDKKIMPKNMTPNDIERSKHMRHEFIRPSNLPDYKYVKPKKNATTDEIRIKKIIKLKKDIKAYEAFSDINDWEHAQILSLKADLAIKEKRHKDTISYLNEIIKGNHVTEETLGEKYYELYNISFHEKDYISARKSLMEAFKRKHLLMPWDFATFSEISFRYGRNEEGIKSLTKAIDELKVNNCPIEAHWLNILTAISTDPKSDSIKKLLSSVEPWFYPVILDTLPEPYHRMLPRYPRSAMERRSEGNTTLSMILNEKGNVVCSVLIKGVGKIFLKPSKEAALKSKYHPAEYNGNPVWAYGIQTHFVYRMH